MPRYLLSYHYSKVKGDDLSELGAALGDPETKFLMDSGAFSAHTLGVEISLDEYEADLRAWEHNLEGFLNLDVILDWEATMKNQMELERRGLEPIPVFHVGTPTHLFPEMAEKYDLIAIGNLTSANKRDPKLWSLLDDLHQIALENDCGLHGLGLVSWPLVRRWPWRSIDSSEWATALRFGNAALYNFYENRWIRLNSNLDQEWHRWGWLVREYGFDLEDFTGKIPTERRGALVSLAGAQWRKAEEALGGTICYHALAFMADEMIDEERRTVSLLEAPDQG
jgi:hypothetical protein